jgi:ferritin-like protein
VTIELDFSKLSGTDVLDMAIAIEDEAQIYYEQLAAWVGDDKKEVANFFLSMAKREQRHHDQIVVQRKRLYGEAPASNAAKVSWAVEMPAGFRGGADVRDCGPRLLRRSPRVRDRRQSDRAL